MDKLSSQPAIKFATAVDAGRIPGVRLISFRQDNDREAIHIEVDVERPQDLAFSIKATEPVVVIFGQAEDQPSILALRKDFPDTPHQNWTPEGSPCSLCIDDRPWAEARLTSTPFDLITRIQLWLAKAARGELHDPAQPLDPLFFRTWLSLVISPSVLDSSKPEPAELIGFTRKDNPGIILTSRALSSVKVSSSYNNEAHFLVIAYQTGPQAMSRLRHAPITLAGLHAELSLCGIDLLTDLKSRLRSWANFKEENIRRLKSRLVILVAFQIGGPGNRTASDFRAFVTSYSAGEVGVALGALLGHQTHVGNKPAYSIAIGSQASLVDIPVQAAEVHFFLNRELGAAVSGREVDRRQAILVGAGSLGSQIGLNLAREGALTWTVVDQDILMPHNLARHGLLTPDTGAPKAFALAEQMGMLVDEPCTGIFCDILKPEFQIANEINTAFAAADIIIDASASVAVSRYLSDVKTSAGRRLSTFFNPAGNAVVLLAEDNQRNITLRDLEAQYHGLLLSEQSLQDHLISDTEGVQYSGSCRSVTNRIPATRASLLSALAARGIMSCLNEDSATLQIWITTPEGAVNVVRRSGSAVTRKQIGSWTLTYNADLVQTLREYRALHLPNETGGILLGVIDISALTIHLAHAMPQPIDSRGSPIEFERGVVGLIDTIAKIAEKSLHQVRYVGEWHSHPVGATVMPSKTDTTQLQWLSNELEVEGIPALMAIVGDNDTLNFLLHEDQRQSNNLLSSSVKEEI